MNKTPIRVLLIEDNPADVVSLRAAFALDALAVFDLSVVENLADALEKQPGQNCDAAMLDLGLPDSQGLATFHTLHQAAPNLPVVVLSALDDQELAQQALQAGAQDYLVKHPQEFPAAGRAVRNAIERQKSEQRFRTIFHNSPTPQYIISFATNRILDVNEAYARMVGYPREAMLNQTSLELGLWSDPQKRAKIIQSLQTTGEVRDLEIDIRTASGEARTILGSVVVIDLRGEKCILSSLDDITDRKRKESELQFQASLLDQVHNAVIVIDFNNTITYWNKHAEELYQWSRREAVGKDIIGLLSPAESVSTVHQNFADLNHDGHWEGEFDVKRKDGSILPAHIVNTYLKDSQGNNTGFIGISEDITSRRQAELNRERLTERLNLATRSARMGIWDWDIRNNKLGWDDQMYALYGLQPGEFGGAYEAWLQGVHPDDREPSNAISAAAVRGEREYDTEFRVLWPDGSVHWLHANGQVFYDAQGQPLRMVGVNVDITQRKHAELELKKNERILRMFVQHSPAAIAMFDRDMRYIVASQRYISDYRLEGKNLAGSTLYEIYPDMTAEHKKVHQGCLAGDVVKSDEDPLPRPDGTLDWARYELRPWYETNGDIGGVIFFSEVITERKRAEDALVESEKRLRLTLESTSDGFWIVDANHHFRDVNPAYCAMSGYSREEFLQMTISDVEVLEEVETTRKRIKKIQREGRDFFETKQRRKDGSVYDAEVTGNLLDPATGLMICFCRDITARKAAEQDAIHRQELLERVIQLGKKIASVTDLDMCLKEIYHSLRFGLGFDRVGLYLYDEARHRLNGVYGTSRTGEIEPPGFSDEPIKVWPGWEQVLQNSTGVVFTENYQEELNLPAEDSMHGVGQHVAAAAWSGEKPVALLAVDNLLTGRRIKPADLEALQLFTGYVGLAIENASLHTDLEKKVEQRTAQVQDLYDHAPAGYHSLDANGCFIQINQTELNWLSYKRDEVIGHSIAEFITEASISAFRQQFPFLKQHGWVRDVEIEYIRKDGTTLSAVLSATAVIDKGGNFLMSRSTVFDNTARKQAEQALRESEAQLRASRDRMSAANVALEKAARMKDEFLASMSHELRTPLSGILGVSEAMQEQVYGSLNEKQLRALANIETSGRHLLDLINDILDVSKLEAGMLVLDIQPCVLGEICLASLQLVRGMAQKKNQSISYSMTPRDILFQADSRRLKQILVNLLSNAVKYSPEGGALGLEVEANQTGHSLRITVWDQGIGIKAEDIDELFQPFVQIDSSLSRQQSGTGLGLNLVQHLVELHGGSIRVESTFGRGSRFTISLPCVSPDLPAETIRPADAPTFTSLAALEMDHTFDTPQGEAASKQPGAPLVLVVDDNEAIRITMLDFLSGRQYRVIVAGSAAEFLDLLSHVHPDLVLMDIQMPGMDGLEAIRRMRAHPDRQIARVPIIALTALAMSGDREKCLAAGANEYLSKPVPLHNLAALIQSLTDHKDSPNT